MKRVIAIAAMLFAVAASAGGPQHGGYRGPYNSGQYGGHGYYPYPYNGWAVAGAIALGATIGYWTPRPYYGGYAPYPYYAPPAPYYNYPPQQVIVCVQSGDSYYFQQGNCFTPPQQYVR